MALYKGATKLSGVGSGFSPLNQGDNGDVLKQSQYGYEWSSIKTINNQSLLGSGNIDVTGVDDTAYGVSWDGDTTHAPSKNAVYDKVSSLDVTISGKQDTLVSGTNIKTINNESLLGSGNINIQGGDTYSAGYGIEIKDLPDYSAMRGPCPEGYHIASKDERIDLGHILNNTFSLERKFTTVQTYLKMPPAGGRSPSGENAGSIIYQGSSGTYWSSTRVLDGFADGMGGSNDPSALPMSWRGNVHCTNGASIRPFKDYPVVPDNTWTILYNGSSIAAGAGIFWSSTLGLISVSGDGQIWTTIADKNLGATTVYNSGDTVNQANCGGYFQWGNNYMFPFTGTVTTSTTKVNASTYGPGNYYGSSTYVIMTSLDDGAWDTPANYNLRGGETGIVTLDNAISVKEDVIKNISMSSSSFGGFINACKANGTVHMSTFTKTAGTPFDEFYTFQGYGYFWVHKIVSSYTPASVIINGVTIIQENSGSIAYSDWGYIGPFTMGPGDVVEFYCNSTSSGDVLSAAVYDYY